MSAVVANTVRVETMAQARFIRIEGRETMLHATGRVAVEKICECVGKPGKIRGIRVAPIEAKEMGNRGAR